MDGEGSSVDLIDPESQAVVVIAGKSKKTDPERIEAELMAGAKAIAGPAQEANMGLMRLHRLGGHQALTWIRDPGNRGRVGYFTWVQSESTRVSIRFQVDAGDFSTFLRRFQPILDSFRTP